MKRIYLISLLFIIACTHNDPESRQRKAEDLVRHYLDSSLTGQGNYKIVNISKIDTIFSGYSEDAKHKNYSLKTDSIKKHFKPQIKGWGLYAIYQGNDAFGAYERHKVLVSIDTGFSRVIAVK